VSYNDVKDTAEDQQASDVMRKEASIQKQQNRLRENVDLIVKDGREHWIWTLSCNDDGYGQTALEGKRMGAHIVSYIVFKNAGKPIPEGLQLRHLWFCPFRNCINPDCLDVGTPKDDAQDKMAAGTLLFGEKHPRATISAKVAFLIKASRGSGTQKERAEKFGVKPGIVNSIDRGETWAHIKI
jgi:hypothetical protein